jgi:hypothetical protein
LPLALKRQLGLSYPTAWLIHHKLMEVMADRKDRYVFAPEDDKTMAKLA